MPKAITMYRDGVAQRNIYPSEAQAWVKLGWSFSPEEGDRPMPSDESVTEPEAVPSLLHINTATADEISLALDGIGDSRAKRIIAKRDTLGQYTDLEQIPFLQDEHKPLVSLEVPE